MTFTACFPPLSLPTLLSNHFQITAVKGNKTLKKHVVFESYLDFLEGAVEHGYEHVQQNNHHDDVVHPIQNIADVLNELMVDV